MEEVRKVGEIASGLLHKVSCKASSEKSLGQTSPKQSPLAFAAHLEATVVAPLLRALAKEPMCTGV